MKRSAKLIGLALAVAMMFSLAACGSTQAPAEDTVKIGSIGPLTGSVSTYGVSVANAIKLAIEEINAAGGVLGGKKLEVIEYMDDKGDSSEAAHAYNSLVGRDVVAILGAVTSGPTAGVATVANSDGMLLLTPTATNDDITVGLSTVFRACFVDSYQGRMSAKFLAEVKGVKKVAVLYASGDAYSAGLYESFKGAAATYGLEIVATESSSSMADIDFSSQLANIAATDAEAIFVPYYYDAVGPYIVPQAREAGFEGMFMGCDGWDGTAGDKGTMVKGQEALYNNSFFTNHYAPEDPSDKVQHFVSAYTAKYGADSLNALAVLGYDATYMLAQAINDANSTETADIIAALKSGTFDVVTGNFSFDENNNPQKPITIVELKDGRNTFVTYLSE
jgi:branched-chain amino acid transport system substrate-binding protein